jgi:DNA-binding NtrC family response regulator
VALCEEDFDVVLLDMNFSAGINNGNEGLFWISEIKKHDADIPVVLFTTYADIYLAVKALKQEGTDFAVKPWDNSKFIATLQSACSLRESKNEVSALHLVFMNLQIVDTQQISLVNEKE